MLDNLRWSYFPLITVPAIPLMIVLPQAELRFVAAGILSCGAVRLWRQAKLYRKKEKILRDAFDLSEQSVIALHPDFSIASVNRRFTESSGFSESSIAGLPFKEVLAPRYQHGRSLNQLWRAVDKHGHWEGRLWMRRRNGEEFPEYRHLTAVIDDDLGKLTGYLLTGYNAERDDQKETQLIQRQQFDALTSLHNRNRLQSLLTFILPKFEHNIERNECIDIALLDIDDFQMVNQSLGALIADNLLQAISDRLEHYSDYAVVGRLGGDEFLVIGVHDGALSHHEWQVALRGQLSMPYCLDGLADSVQLSFSVATTRAPDDHEIATTGDTLLQMLESTMARAKMAGGNHTERFNPTADRLDEDTLMQIQSLRRAITEGKGLSLHYQTQHCLHTGAVLGMEGLLRWQSPKGSIPPDVFIPLSERHGLIEELGAWVINEAARQIAEWRNAGKKVPCVWINISPIQFFKEGLEATIENAIRQNGIKPEQLGLEITESDILDSRAGNFLARIARLRERGHLIAIDDFGTGHSSLHYLESLPFDKIKLDRVFVNNLAIGGANERIVASVLSIAETCESMVIAEGVETSMQVEQLLSLGCDRGQGYFYSRPVPAAEISLDGMK